MVANASAELTSSAATGRTVLGWFLLWEGFFMASLVNAWSRPLARAGSINRVHDEEPYSLPLKLAGLLLEIGARCNFDIGSLAISSDHERSAAPDFSFAEHLFARDATHTNWRQVWHALMTVWRQRNPSSGVQNLCCDRT